jgi:hypothetical protein
MTANGHGFIAFSALLLAGAVGWVAQADTDWDALSGADWRAIEPADGDTLDEAAAGTDAWGATIQRSFVNLGMAEARAKCFGHVLAKQLSAADQQQATLLVSRASSADEVKTGVMSGGPEMVGGFSAAGASCPENMGG